MEKIITLHLKDDNNDTFHVISSVKYVDAFNKKQVYNILFHPISKPVIKPNELHEWIMQGVIDELGIDTVFESGCFNCNDIQGEIKKA